MTREEAINILKQYIDYDNADVPDFYTMAEACEVVVKALEQEPCEDCISRQAVIRTIYDRKSDFKNDFAQGFFADEIKALPPVTPQPNKWIPVSERLPEDIRPVMVTWKNNDPESYYQYIVGKHFIGVAHYLKGKWYWYSSTTEDFLAEYGRYDGEEFDEAIEVVAWCPLPKPYKAEGSDKE